MNVAPRPLLKLPVLLIVLVGAAALGAYLFRAHGPDLRVTNAHDITQRNLVFAPPHNLSPYLAPGDRLVLLTRNISDGLLKRLRLRIRAACDTPGGSKWASSPFVKERPSYTFEETGGPYRLYVDVKDTETGLVWPIEMPAVLVGPKVAVTGLSQPEATAAVAQSRSSDALRQVSASVLLLAMGMALLAVFRSRLSLGWLMLLSFPTGVCLWVLFSLVVLMLRVDYSAAVMACFLAAFFIAAILAARRGGGWRRRDLGVLASYLAGFVVLCFVLLRFDTCLLLWDSWRYVYFGKHLAFYGDLKSGVEYPISYGVLGALTQSIGVFFRFELFSIVQPLLFISTLGIVCFSLVTRCRQEGGSPAWGIVLAGLLLACVLTTYLGLASAFWLLPNVFAGVFLVLALICLETALSTNNRALLVTGSIFTIAFALSRIEGPIMALAILITYFRQKRPDLRDVMVFFVPFFVLTSAWYVTIYSVFDLGRVAGFLTDTKVFLVVSLSIVLTAAVLLARKYDSVNQTLRAAIGLLPRLLLAFAIGVACRRPLQAGNNFFCMLANLLGNGSWGGFWIMACLVAPFMFFARPFRGERFFRFPIVILLLLTFDVFLFRAQWLRIHLMDSGNRLFIHYALLVIYYFCRKFAVPAPDRIGARHTPECVPAASPA